MASEEVVSVVPMGDPPLTPITIAVGSLDDPRSARYDVVVEQPDDPSVAAIRSTAAHNPLASVALVQLLRASVSLPTDDAVVCESFVYSMLQGGPEFARWLAQRGPRTPRYEPEPVLFDREADLLHLTLNRPEVRNAYNAAMREALLDGFDLFEADESLTRVIVDANGPAFSAGGDLNEFGTFSDPASAHLLRTTRSVARRIVRYPESVTFLVHGACIGAGVELPAFAGRVVATADAFFQLPEVSMGLVPGAGGTASVTCRIGRHRTAWMALTGARVDAATALAWGLVDEIVE